MHIDYKTFLEDKGCMSIDIWLNSWNLKYTMDGQTRAVRGVAEPPPRSVRRYYKDLSYDLIKSYERDKLLNDLLETDTKEDKDWREFLDEKDMEL